MSGKTFEQVIDGWRESHKEVGWHEAECCVNDLLDEASVILAALRAELRKIAHQQHTVWKDGIDIEECWPHCSRCSLELIIGYER